MAQPGAAGRGDIEHLEHSRLRVELAKLQDELMHVERGDGANETKGSAPRREGADLRDAEESLNLGISIRCYD